MQMIPQQPSRPPELESWSFPEITLAFSDKIPKFPINESVQKTYTGWAPELGPLN